jgi:transposase-like protein
MGEFTRDGLFSCGSGTASSAWRVRCHSRGVTIEGRIIDEVDRQNQIISSKMFFPFEIDETYIKVKGTWVYLYRAVDKAGRTVDFYLSRKRDVAAAKAFLRQAMREQRTPTKIEGLSQAEVSCKDESRCRSCINASTEICGGPSESRAHSGLNIHEGMHSAVLSGSWHTVLFFQRRRQTRRDCPKSGCQR